MIRPRVALILVLPFWLVSCAHVDEGDTLADLRNVRISIKDDHIEGGIDKAIEGYRRYLEETPESRLTPEALRRLADLKVQKEYGFAEGAARQAGPAKTLDKPAGLGAARLPTPPAPPPGKRSDKHADRTKSESDSAFEKRAAANMKIAPGASPAPVVMPDGAAADLQNAGAAEAIALYLKLLAKYPHYERNDQVLYNLSRAYEETGQVEEAMKVMTRIASDYPRSKYMDEIQFRRGEYFFTRKKYLDSEEAYKTIVEMGQGSFYYELALYKLGWSLYKQELYDESLSRFFGVLDHRVNIGYDFDKAGNDIDRKRVEDTFRVISLAFSYTGGPVAVTDFFAKRPRRPYEVNIYGNLGEHYLEKRRYADAAASYQAFVKRNPFHKIAPDFDMKVIEIYKKGGFPKLVIDASKAYATNYGLKSDYWKYFDIKSRPEVVGHLKQNLRELANYYHSLYQNKEFARTRDENFRDAQHWYREFLASFPRDTESPVINYQLAELLLENKAFAEAAVEFERTAYAYETHDKAAAAGYAAVYAHREHVKIAAAAAQDHIKRDVIRSSLRFVDAFPAHEKAAIVLGAAADDLFELKDYKPALVTAHRLINQFTSAEPSLQRSAWIVVAHASFELQFYPDAENGYRNVLRLTGKDDKSVASFHDNLAASIYKQGELAAKAEDHKTAAQHFLRVAEAAPNSKIRPTAEYDGASSLMKLKEWDHAVEVLQAFRKNYPKHELQPEVTKKIAFAYRETGKLAIAAAEYERIEKESKDEDARRGALLIAADLYEQAREIDRALDVYRRFVKQFPKPLELALESRHKISLIHKARDDTKAYFAELQQIMDLDARAGSERTDRTRYLGATAALGLTEPLYDQFTEIKLVKPINKTILKKKTAMKAALDGFGKLTKYEVGDVTAAATYYIAEIYFHFNRALVGSERPTNLNAVELEQYELALEEQAFPFEEKAITAHEKNIELLALGVGSLWIDKSLGKLATLVPARYAKPEERTGYITILGPFPSAIVARAPVRVATGKAAKPVVAQAGVDKPSPPADKPADQPDPQPK
jgi:TolA-binding protein